MTYLYTVDIANDELVLDIGSNDGTTLGFYPKHISSLVGIDPTSKYFRIFALNMLNRIRTFSPKLYMSIITGSKKQK